MARLAALVKAVKQVTLETMDPRDPKDHQCVTTPNNYTIDDTCKLLITESYYQVVVNYIMYKFKPCSYASPSIPKYPLVNTIIKI